MPTKTITLEIDTYEKLRLPKRGGESFTEVVRRAVIPASAPTAATPREHCQGGGAGVCDGYLDSVEQAMAHEGL